MILYFALKNGLAAKKKGIHVPKSKRAGALQCTKRIKLWDIRNFKVHYKCKLIAGL